MAKVTIRHVAERAGVSTSTVSRTLHNHPKISEETKQRVMDAVHALNYRAHVYPPAETLHAIALLLPTGANDLFLHPFYSQVTRGITSFAQANDYVIVMASSKDEEEKLDYLQRFLSAPIVRGVVTVASKLDDRCCEYLSGADVPFVVIGRPASAADILWVDNDNFHAMYDAVNRLIERGSRRIAFLGGPVEMIVTRDRLEGYRMALANRGLEQVFGFIAHADEVTEAAGFSAMHTILVHGTPDALVTTDDFLALGALQACAERGVGPLRCIGFNNSAQAAEHSPGLSSVEIQPVELGRHATRLLIERIENGRPTENHVIVPTRFIARETA